MIRRMTRNAVLEIVVFSIFVGLAICAVGEVARPAVALIDAAKHARL